MAFEGLSEKLQGVFKKLKGKGVITEAELKVLEEKVEAEIEDAVEYAKTAPLPENESALHNVFWEG